MRFLKIHRLIAASGVLLMAVGAARPAGATPIMVGSVTVLEHDTGFPDTSDVVTIGPGVEIAAGDSTNIGAILLDGESINIGPTSILFTIYGGGSSSGHTSGFLGTSYVDGDYTFSGIGLSSPGHISGVTFSSPDNTVADTGTLGLGSTNDSIFLHLADIGIKSSPANL